MSGLALKKQAVAEIKDRFARAQSVVIVEYRGLNVGEITELRAKLRATEVEMKVFKNTLAQRAAEAHGVAELKQYLEGPTAGVFSIQDPVSGPKILLDFAKTHKQLVIKGGVLENKVLDAAGVKALAELPSREVLLGQVLAGIQGPLSGMANVLQGPLRKFVYALEALKKEREQA
ncbi:MAG: 50S ribosomal protein L10 [Clostridia bacterium]|nr:50S ribosomal protein L10 [Clostridia bacterium]MDD4145918.1 50S ribosomal protein L10 [Clostridia bacterium]MDD4665351.1 50S ribosomal protein L10 [Clostridia bacterium]